MQGLEALNDMPPEELMQFLAAMPPEIRAELVSLIRAAEHQEPEPPASQLGYVTVGRASPDELPPALARLGRRGWVGSLPYITPTDELGPLTSTLAAKYPGDFCVGSCFDVDFITRLIYHGYLTMCERVGPTDFVLLPKLHTERCVLQWTDLHVEKNARKRSKKFQLCVDQDFDGVFDGCVAQHGENWLHKPLRRVFKSIFDVPGGLNGVSVHTVELRDAEGTLVAGELATAVGGCYTALSGFRTVSSSGSIQMICTARVLEAAGFAFWDLGMVMDYKARLGAREMPRGEFLKELARVRDCSEVKLQPIVSLNAHYVISQSAPLWTPTEGAGPEEAAGVEI